MSKLWELQQFDKRTIRTELERIPEFEAPVKKRPGSHLPSIEKPQRSRHSTNKKLAPYEPTVVDRQLRRVMREKRSNSTQNVASEIDGMLLTFMKPEQLPQLVPPPLPNRKHSDLSKILSNRSGYIDGYFDSIRELRTKLRERQPTTKQFDPVYVGPWVICGELTSGILLLRGFDEPNGRRLTRKYQLTQKLAQKIDRDYPQWVASKFSE